VGYKCTGPSAPLNLSCLREGHVINARGSRFISDPADAALPPSDVVGKSKGLQSDYVSFQIENGRPKEAVEVLEQGRALLWSEMRGLRTSHDQIAAADPVLAERFADVNRNLQIVTMSVAQSESIGTGDSAAGNQAGNHEGMDPFGHLLMQQRRLSEERTRLSLAFKPYLVSRIS